jgi:hypothetical protein
MGSQRVRVTLLRLRGCSGAEPLGRFGRQGERPARHGERRGLIRDHRDRRVKVLPQPVQQRHERLERRAGSDGREDRDPRLQQREWAVLEVGRGVRVGEDPGELLELERPLPGGCIFVPAREDEQAIGADLVAGHRLDCRLEPDRRGHRVGDRGDRIGIRRIAGERRRKCRDRQQLGRVGLGRRDRELGPGAEVDAGLRGRRQRRRRIVGDGERGGTLPSTLLDDRDHVR